MIEAVVQRCSVKKVFSLTQVFPCEFRKISKDTFSYRTPPVAASALSSKMLLLETSFILKKLMAKNNWLCVQIERSRLICQKVDNFGLEKIKKIYTFWVEYCINTNVKKCFKIKMNLFEYAHNYCERSHCFASLTTWKAEAYPVRSHTS